MPLQSQKSTYNFIAGSPYLVVLHPGSQSIVDYVVEYYVHIEKKLCIGRSLY